jgi:hypothetical protein
MQLRSSGQIGGVLFRISAQRIGETKMDYLNIAAMFLLVLWPAWLPLTLHGSHTIANRQRKFRYAEPLASS